MADETPDENKDRETEIRELKEKALKLEADLSEARRKKKTAETPKEDKAAADRVEKIEAAIAELRAEIKALKPAAPAKVQAFADTNGICPKCNTGCGGKCVKKSSEPWD